MPSDGTVGELGDAWRSYHAETMPAAVFVLELLQTRRAFYAGALAVLRLMLKAREKEDPATLAIYIAGLTQEVVVFEERLGKEW